MKYYAAFKCVGITPAMETEIGQEMLAHEETIDRGYLLNSTIYGRHHRPFPNRTKAALRIIRQIYIMYLTRKGSTFGTSDLSKFGAHATVANCLRKLVLCKGISVLEGHRNKRKQYRVTPQNETVIKGILFNE